MPIGMSAISMSTTPQGVGSGAATGITAKVTSAGTVARIGPRMKYSFAELAGSVSSLRKFLTPSASGWNRPKGPTRFGPLRSWIHAATRRSASVAQATTTMKIEKIPTTFRTMKMIAGSPVIG